MLLPYTVLLSILPAFIAAANNWDDPCTSGTCKYETGDGKNTAWSTISIDTVSPGSLSDITGAAGWAMIDCDQDSTESQNIRLVCTDREKGCDHVFQDGIENTIVRLPQDCTGGPFARVVRSWVAEDQSLPRSLAKRKLDSPVRAIHIDFDFAKIPESKGKVFITASATNSEAQRDSLRASVAKRSIRHVTRASHTKATVRDFAAAPQAARRNVISAKPSRRGFFDSITNAVGNAVDSVQDAASNVVEQTTNVVSGASDQVGDFLGGVGSSVSEGVSDASDFVSDAASDVVDAVGGGVEESASFLDESAGKVVNGASDAVGGLVNGAGEVVDNVGDAIGDLTGGVGDLLGGATDAIGNGVSKIGDQIGAIVDTASDNVEKFVDAVDDKTGFNQTFSKDFDLINVKKTFPVFSTSINCPGEGSQPDFEAGIDISADVKAKVSANVGFIVAGSIVPPNIDDIAFTASLTGDASATFNVKANAQGTFDTGVKELFKVGLPGLSFPGILTVGPAFSINAQGVANLGITADLVVASSFEMDQIDLVFPPEKGKSVAKVNPGASPIKLDVGASAELTGRAEVHLIPRLDIGVDILKGAAKATVFLDVDGSAGLDFTLAASAGVTPVSGTLGDPQFSLKEVETKFGGSVGLDATVSINAGADANLLDFFEAGTKVPLFSKTFPLFEKSFGDVKKRSTISARQNGLTCPPPGEAVANQPLIDANAPAPTR